jgi:AraC-like DNA-binding protein
MPDGPQPDEVALSPWHWDRNGRLGARARSEANRYMAVERVIAAMHDRIDRPFALEEMARIAYLSPFYFNRVFRQITCVPPGRFHTALRMAAAKRLLLTTELSVTEVCLEVGYWSLGTFTTHFHDLVGVSPRQLRRLACEHPDALAKIGSQAWSDRDAAPVAVQGTVIGPTAGGLVFVGLFDHPYPHGRPVACTAIAGLGAYCLRTGVEGRFHLAAAAFAPSEDACGCLLPDEGSLLVASSRVPVQLGSGRRATRSLCLRPARATDPPILLALPLAVARDIAAPDDGVRELQGLAPV